METCGAPQAHTVGYPCSDREGASESGNFWTTSKWELNPPQIGLDHY